MMSRVRAAFSVPCPNRALTSAEVCKHLPTHTSLRARRTRLGWSRTRVHLPSIKQVKMPRVAARSALTTLPALAGLAGGAVIFIPDMRDWFAKSAWWAWSLSLILTLAVASLITVWDNTRQQLTAARGEIDVLGQRITDAGASIDGTQRKLNDAHGKVDDLEHRLVESNTMLAGSGKQLEDAQGRIAILEGRLAEPSTRDRTQFESILNDMPWGRGIMAWLDNSPLKQWNETQCDPIYALEGKWVEWFFDSPSLEESFDSLHQALREFTNWMATRGFPLNTSEIRVFGWKEGDPTIYRIVSGDERADGWKGHDADRSEGHRLASDLLDRRRAFERAGRAAGL